MIRSLSRRLRPLARFTRTLPLGWGLALAAAACNSAPLASPPPKPEKQVSLDEVINPSRAVDILFLVDNSTSMLDEQEKLKRNFPEFMKKLEAIRGGLPDVNIAVVTSDFGTGWSATCDEVKDEMGNRAPFGDAGVFRTFSRVQDANLNTVTTPCTLNAGERWIRAWKGERNFTGSLESVFTCMATQGVKGCGLEQQLQSVRYALYKEGQSIPFADAAKNTPGQRLFLRDDAYLAVIFITDEDDCSTNADQASTEFYNLKNEFGNDANVETESFRCARSGHVCDGMSPGDANMSVAFNKCSAKGESNPLIKVSEVVDQIKNLKRGDTSRIFVSGIIGWPNNPAQAMYGVAKNPDQRDRWDLTPACTIPQQGGGPPSRAYPGLRLKQFVDAFKKNTGEGVYSICQDNLSNSLADIGDALAKTIEQECLSSPLKITNGKAECVVQETQPGKAPVAIPECGTADPCWQYVPASAAECAKVIIKRAVEAPPNTTVSTDCLGNI